MKTDEGCKYFPDVDTEIDEVNEDVYTIVGDDPLSAEAYSYRSCTIIYQVWLDSFQIFCYCKILHRQEKEMILSKLRQ